MEGDPTPPGSSAFWPPFSPAGGARRQKIFKIVAAREFDATEAIRRPSGDVEILWTAWKALDKRRILLPGVRSLA